MPPSIEVRWAGDPMSPDAPPAIGSMRLYDAVVPAMPSGAHRVTSTVTLEAAGVDAQLTSSVHRDFVTVGGSALRFQPTEVLATHPPKNATGGFGDVLPHVVLRRRTLPWERSASDGAPWLALLVFLDSEVSFASGSLSTLLPGVASQFGTDGASPDAAIDVVTVTDASVLSGVLPTPSELSLLSHVRRVNTADTTLDLGDDDGWLAVVAANRLPVRPADGPGHYHACVVSLEHRDDVFAGASQSLVLLYRWDFITDTGGTFQKLSQDLDVGTLGQAGEVTDSAGRVPLTVTGRDGTPGTASYRGPFTLDGAPLADDASDVSYDAARELGRLLAAADGALTRELIDWHRGATAATQTLVQHAAIRSRAAASAPELTTAHGTVVHAAALGLDTVLRSLAPLAPHRRTTPAGGDHA
jgi:hypothetical protein